MIKRNSNIELLRILLLMLLVFTHVATFIIPGGRSNLPLSIAWIDKISMISVNCFAIITGYFTFGSKKIRVKKYAYWLLLVCIFTFILYCIILIPLKLWGFSSRFNSTESWLGVLTFGSWNNWYLWASLGLYVLGPIFSWGLERIKTSTQISMLIFMIMFSVVLMALNHRFHTDFYQIFSRSGFQWIFIVFFLGHTIARTKNHYSWTWISVSFSMIFFIIWCVAFSRGTMRILKSPIFATEHGSLLTMFMACLVFALFLRIKFESKIINWLSKRMIFIYPMHHIFIIIFKNKLSIYFGYYETYFFSQFFIFSLTAALSIIISYPIEIMQKTMLNADAKICKRIFKGS